MHKTRRKLKAVHKLKAGSKRKARHIRKTTRTQKGGNISMGNLIKAAGQYNFEKYDHEKLKKIFDEKYTPEKRHRICDDIKSIDKNISYYEKGSGQEAINNLNYLKKKLKNYFYELGEEPECLFPPLHQRMSKANAKAPIIGEIRYIGPDNSNKCLVDKVNKITLNRGEILNVHKRYTKLLADEHTELDGNLDHRLNVSKKNDPTQFDINMINDCFEIIKEETGFENVFSDPDSNYVNMSNIPENENVQYATLKHPSEPIYVNMSNIPGSRRSSSSRSIRIPEPTYVDPDDLRFNNKNQGKSEPIYAVPNNKKIENIEAGSIIEFPSMPKNGCWGTPPTNYTKSYKEYYIPNPFIDQTPKLKVVDNKDNILVVTNPNAEGTYSSGDKNDAMEFSIKKDCLKKQKFNVISNAANGGKRKTRRNKKNKRKTRK